MILVLFRPSAEALGPVISESWLVRLKEELEMQGITLPQRCVLCDLALSAEYLYLLIYGSVHYAGNCSFVLCY